tara:strand:- start:82 stop:813 length:732 start_codon:yes stop_codon:yes gene_type:complete
MSSKESKKIEDTFNLVKPNNKETVKTIQNDLKNIHAGDLKVNQGTASLSVGIINSNAISAESLKLIKGIESKWTPSHINKLSKMFVRDILEENFKQFDKVKKQALKKSMKIAVAIITQNSLGTFTDNKSYNSKGEIAIKSNKFTKKLKDLFDSSGTGGVKALSVKNATTYSSDVLGMKVVGGSELKGAIDKVMSLITSEKHYDNMFEDLPSDCRALWLPLRNKVQNICTQLKVDTQDKIYATK